MTYSIYYLVPDCGLLACTTTYNAASTASQGNLSLVCAAAENYLTCLNAIKNCPNMVNINSEKQVAWDVIRKNPCRPTTPCKAFALFLYEAELIVFGISSYIWTDSQ